MSDSTQRAEARHRSDFGVVFAATRSHVPFAMASISSLRAHSPSVPVRLVVDAPDERAEAAARRLRVELVTAPLAVENEFIRSRLLKIGAIGSAPFDDILYIDSDTLLLDDVLEVRGLREAEPHGDRPLMMLLRRPVIPTLMGFGRLNFTARDPSADDIRDLLRRALDIRLTSAELDRLLCWNSGVLLGRAGTLRPLCTRWAELYRRIATGPHRAAFVPNDQLCLWLALHEAADRALVGELPLRWNFMPGLALRAPLHGTTSQDQTAYLEVARLNGGSLTGEALREVSLLHFARNKYDDWALELAARALEEAGVDFPLPARDRQSASGGS
ncbi:hypothetical protein ACIP6P_15945 [Streptomyces sp. NPDC088729]|uniref:hypothetical protein n=1 Tax=Streptomyces sp. NPDC088729 TaxID=3365876 RepID=UPI0038267502